MPPDTQKNFLQSVYLLVCRYQKYHAELEPNSREWHNNFRFLTNRCPPANELLEHWLCGRYRTKRKHGGVLR